MMVADTAGKKRVLSVFSLVMINVIAVDSLRSLPINAEYGFSLIFFCLVATLAFLIPCALIGAELATAWPNTGGVYVWVREAFGPVAGFLVVWLQWIYNVVWYPTILSLVAATIAYVVNPALAQDKTYMLLTVLVLFWGATLANWFGMKLSSWISTVGALVGTLFPMAFIVILAVIWVVMGHPVNIDVSWHALIPQFHHFSDLAFFIAIVYGLLGIEMSAVHAGEVRNPQRDYPRAMLISAVIIFISLVLSSLAIAVVIPKPELNIVTGMIGAFATFFKAFHMPWMEPVIAALIVLGGIGGVATWIIGPTKGLMVAAQDQVMPKFFARQNQQGVPVNLLLMQGLIFSALCSVFILMPGVSSSYWLLTALTAQIALVQYIIMFLAAIRLRYSRPNVKRSFQIPGGKPVMYLVAGTGIATCVFAIALGFVPPTEIFVGSLLRYELILLVGIAALCSPPLIIAYVKNR